MAYCTEAQVEGEFKSVDFGASTAVTSDDITRFIEEADAFIDGKIGVRYVVPITGSISLLIIRTIAISLIAAVLVGFYFVWKKYWLMVLRVYLPIMIALAHVSSSGFGPALSHDRCCWDSSGPAQR